VCKPLTCPVPVGDGENGVVAVVYSNELAAVRRRRLVDVMFQNTGTAESVSESQPALRSRDDQIVAREVDRSVERVASQVDRDISAEDTDVGGCQATIGGNHEAGVGTEFRRNDIHCCHIIGAEVIAADFKQSTDEVGYWRSGKRRIVVEIEAGDIDEEVRAAGQSGVDGRDIADV